MNLEGRRTRQPFQARHGCLRDALPLVSSVPSSDGVGDAQSDRPPGAGKGERVDLAPRSESGSWILARRTPGVLALWTHSTPATPAAADPIDRESAAAGTSRRARYGDFVHRDRDRTRARRTRTCSATRPTRVASRRLRVSPVTAATPPRYLPHHLADPPTDGGRSRTR